MNEPDIFRRLDRLESLLLSLLSQKLPAQEWFSIEEVAVMTGLSRDHVRRAVVGGTLPASNMGTKDRALYRISRSAVETWMKEREAGAKPPVRKARASGGWLSPRHR